MSLAAEYLIDTSVVTKLKSTYLDVDTRFGSDYGRVIPLDRKLAPRGDACTADTRHERQGALYEMYKSLLNISPRSKAAGRAESGA